MNEAQLNKYCDLILKIGVNLYEGQCLVISCSIGNADFAMRLAESAYKMGAKFVEFIYSGNKIKKIRIENNRNINDLDYLPNFYIVSRNEFIANDYAFIRIDNLEEIDDLKNIDSEKFGMTSKKDSQVASVLSQAITSSKIAWCIVATPGPGWAAKVFNCEKSDNATNELSEKLVKVLRLDKDDPSAAWEEQGEKLIKRSGLLSSMALDKLIFTGPGTNLEIGLNSNAIWKGGFAKAQNGRKFIPNLPTEEVFTVPDYKRVNGKVSVTKPVKVLENILTGIWFEFKDGQVIDFGCDSRRELLEKYFSTDEGSRYLGEVALVDKNSEVHKSGVIFNSILYDENAACHIALGRGISICFENKDEMNTPEEMKKNGCNYSLVHTDFMIGSDDINVLGITSDGKEYEIIKEGEFVI